MKRIDMKKNTYQTPSTHIVVLGTTLLLNDVSKVTVNPEKEGNQEEAESRRWRNRLWDEESDDDWD